MLVSSPPPSPYYFPAYGAVSRSFQEAREYMLSPLGILPDTFYETESLYFSSTWKVTYVLPSFTADEQKAFYAAIEASTDRKVTMTIQIEEAND